MNSQYEKGKRIRIIPTAMGTSILLLLLLSLVPSSILYTKAAFGDGLFMEELSASFGDRKADLIIKMTPPVVTTETLKSQNQKPIIQFKLYDPTTKEGYKHVTYYITIEKDGKKLLSDWFHDHKGDLKIEMKPSDTERVTVYGEPDPILQAFTGTENSPVVATGPIFSEGGLYHFIVRITTIDYDRSFIPDDKQPIYDGWLSVGSTLHQQVSIPKGNSLASQSYTGEINGIDVTKNLMVDPSNSTKNVVHFMLPKPEVVQIAKEVNNNGQTTSNGLMEFSLAPSANATSSSSMHDMANMTGM